MIRIYLSNKSFLKNVGYINSIKKGKPLDANNDPIPWMNYNVISFFKQKLNRQIDMFEFGSGYSSMFFSKYVNTLTSLEYDNNWFNFIKSQLPENADLHLCHLDKGLEYSRFLLTLNKKYNLILIDGADRVNCIKSAIKSLTTNGVIVLDDSQRIEYNEGIEFLEINGFKNIKFEGIKPGSIELYETTIFYKTKNCLEI